LTTDFSPSEKWKQLCYSSFPPEFFNSRCATVAQESLKSPLRSHHRDRERHVGLKSLFKRLLNLIFVASVPVLNESKELISRNETGIGAKGI